MLDKISEKILQFAIDSCNGDIDVPISISEAMADKLQISESVLISACQILYENGYLCDFQIYIDGVGEAFLTYKGYSYFEQQRLNRHEFYKELAFSKITDILIAFITALITAANWKLIFDFLINLFTK